MPDFSCADCGDGFSLPQHVLDRYPGWTPNKCRSCRDAKKTSATGSRPRKPAEIVDDPQEGVFTDGSSVPNPGPGGWAAVRVVDGVEVDSLSGSHPDTTNNRMELEALIHAVDLVPEGESATIYSDSNLAVQTINEWAAGWKRRGWKRKSGPVENLDLVKVAFEKYQERPELELVWIRAHVGFTWNERADELANMARETGR